MSCFFCLRPFAEGQRRTKHHKIPRRYHRHGRENVVPAHETCHRTFHRWMDRYELSFEGYLKRFGESLGEGILAF